MVSNHCTEILNALFVNGGFFIFKDRKQAQENMCGQQ